MNNGWRRTFDLVMLALLILVSASIVISVYFYIFDANPPATFNNQPWPTDKQIYHAGDPIIVTADNCRFTTARASLSISFVDEIAYNLPEKISGSRIDVGCKIVQAAVVTVPVNLPPGLYHLTGVASYPVNVLVTRTVTWQSAEFEVK